MNYLKKNPFHIFQNILGDMKVLAHRRKIKVGKSVGSLRAVSVLGLQVIMMIIMIHSEVSRCKNILELFLGFKWSKRLFEFREMFNLF